MVCKRQKATCVGFSWQRTVSGKDAGSCQNSECSIEELSMRCYNGDGQESHEELCGCCVEGPEERSTL